MTVAKQTGNAQQWLTRSLLTVFLCLAQTACISTTQSVFTENASPEKALQERVDLARRYIGEGNWEDAKRNLELAAEIDGNNAKVHEAFALVYQSTGEYELAEEHYQKALRLDRNFSRARNNFAAFLFSQKRFEEAERELEIVVKDTLYDARANAFINLGLCRLQLDNTAGADEAFTRALAMDRTSRIASLELATIRFEEGDLRSANRHYNTYRRVVRQQSARGLLLGYRLARKTGDKDA